MMSLEKSHEPSLSPSDGERVRVMRGTFNCIVTANNAVSMQLKQEIAERTEEQR
jgi:hypothetical protein